MDLTRIAALLMPGGSTAHSCFGISIKLNEISVSFISDNSAKDELIRKVNLII